MQEQEEMPCPTRLHQGQGRLSQGVGRLGVPVVGCLSPVSGEKLSVEKHTSISTMSHGATFSGTSHYGPTRRGSWTSKTEIQATSSKGATKSKGHRYERSVRTLGPRGSWHCYEPGGPRPAAAPQVRGVGLAVLTTRAIGERWSAMSAEPHKTP